VESSGLKSREENDFLDISSAIRSIIIALESIVGLVCTVLVNKYSKICFFGLLTHLTSASLLPWPPLLLFSLCVKALCI
jgi:hypothetical protein